MKIFCFLFIVLVAFFFGCKKNNLFNLHGKYINDNVFLIDKPIMYTVGNSISNIALIKDYIQRKGNADYFVFDASTLLLNGSPLSINFLSESKVELKGMPGYTEQAEITERTNKLLLISSMDSSIYFAPNSNDRCQLIGAKIPAVSPEVDCSSFYVIPGPGGFPSIGGCKYRQTFPIIVSGNNLYLPLLSYSISYDNSSFFHCSSAVSGIVNTFNENILKELKAGDTIVIQKRKVMMIKEG